MSVEKRDWKKIVADSKGTRVFLPESLMEKGKKYQKERGEFNEFLSQVAEKEIKIQSTYQELALAIRNYFAENGRKDIWLMDVGLELEALKEGEYVINIVDPKDQTPVPPQRP